MPEKDAREALAELAHDMWAGWMRWQFKKGIVIGADGMSAHPGDADAKMIIPEWAIARWYRQMNTPYAELSEAEKESDRAEADRMLAIFNECFPPLLPIGNLENFGQDAADLDIALREG